MAKKKKTKAKKKKKVSQKSKVSQEKENKDPQKKLKVAAKIIGGNVFTESSDAARDLYGQSRYGSIKDNGTVELSLNETAFLLEKGKIELFDGKNKKLDFDSFLNRAKRFEANFWIRYCVFKDLRNRGYIVKTALKFGADFRVYDRGIKPGEDHARWVVFPVPEGNSLTWYEFAAKNRVAHSTKKRLMLGITDAEGDVTYYEVRWIRP